MKRQVTTHIVIHCSASGKDVTHVDIDEWHRARGWKKGGYHRIITASGNVVSFDSDDKKDYGRQIDEVGAHADVAGIKPEDQYNYRSIGICWIGGKNGAHDISEEQYLAMVEQCVTLMELYPDIQINTIIGHNEVPGVNKSCPIIDMSEFRYNLAVALGIEKKFENVKDVEEFKFDDLEKSHWAYNDIKWAVQEAKLFAGVQTPVGPVMEPDRPVTRAELAVIFRRFDQYLKGI